MTPHAQTYRVSAIVSAYNSERFIRGCIEDLLEQTLYKKGGLEIIVIDSGSQQNEGAIVAEYRARHANIVYERTERETLYGAWNRAAQKARGTYLTNANTDDRHRHDSFELLARTLDETRAGIAYCDVLVTSIENETFENNSADRIWALPDFSVRQALAHCPFGSQVMWRRTLHDEVGWFDDRLKTAGDYEFFLRASIHAGAVHLKDVLGLYYESDENLSYADPDRVMHEVGTFLKKYRMEVPLGKIYPFLAADRSDAALLAAKIDFANTISCFSVYPDYELAIRILTEALPLNAEHAVRLRNNIGVLMHKWKHDSEAVKIFEELRALSAEAAANFESVAAGGQELKVCQMRLPSLLEMGDVVRFQNRYLPYRPEPRASLPARHEAAPVALPYDLIWTAPIFNPSGYASEAISFFLGLDRHTDFTIRHLNNLLSQTFIENIPARWKEVLFRRHKVKPEEWAGLIPMTPSSVLVQHQPAHAFVKMDGLRRSIGRTMFETDRIPQVWVEKCNAMDEVWLPSRFNKRTFIESGVKEEKIHIIPGSIDTSVFTPEGIEPLELPNKAGYNFLSMFEWTNRKGWDVLLRAYFEAFTASDDVCLYLRTYLLGHYDGDTKARITELIDQLIRRCGFNRARLPRYELLTNQLPFNDMLRLYKAVDAFVLPSRGEGWGRPQMEAMAFGLPVIGTNWSGNTEFMTQENSYLIDVERLVTIEENEIPIYLGHQWAEPSRAHLKQIFRRVLTHQDEARRKGAEAKSHIAEYFNVDAVARIVLERLKEIGAETDRSAAAFHAASSARAGTAAAGKQAKPAITWEGSQFVYHSLALINREMCTRLAGEPGIELSLIPFEADRFTPAPTDPASALKAYINKDIGPADLHVRLQWPPNLTPPEHGRWVINQPWEFGALPLEWVRVFSKDVDEMWVISSYVRDTYIASGIDPGRVAVIPCGIDPKKFHRKVKPFRLRTKKKFRFLFVGGTIYRKGIDILLDAYTQSFTSKDDVCLVIKDMGGDSFYKGMNAKERIEDLRKQQGAPSIEYIDRMCSEEEIAGLYTACDVLVHPYRGEGFGLPILESMACGTPAIVPNGGACLDFCTSDNSLLVEAPKIFYQNRRVGEFETAIEPWLLEPSLEDVKSKMRFAFGHPDEMRELGAKASLDAHARWTWDHAYGAMKERISALMTRPIRRFDTSREEGGILELVDRITERIACGDAQAALGLLAGATTLIENTMTSLDKESILAELAKLRAMIARTLDEPVHADGRLEEAERLLSEQKTAEAVNILAELAEEDPSNIDVLNDLGAAAIMMGNYPAAIDFLSKVTAIDPGNATALENLAYLQQELEHSVDEDTIQEAEALINAGNTAEARMMLNRLLDRNAGHIHALNDLSVIEIMEKNWAEAAQLINRVITIDPMNEIARQNLEYLDQTVSELGAR